MAIPISTYRLQFNSGFRFEDAKAIVGYLSRLGITDLYASPILQARTGSTHGYDVTDPTRLNSELGAEADFDAFSDALKANKMGLLLDIVPNHMAASFQNPWWSDVLKNGRDSPYEKFFDIDWDADSKLVLPILGAPYGQVLENSELQLRLDYDGVFLYYYDNRLPLNREALSALVSHESSISIVDDLEDAIAESPQLRAHLLKNTELFNGERGVSASFDLLDGLISRQSYRLAFWRSASESVNYRRFFDISDLAGLRVELPEVFDETHALILRLAREGKVTGLRIDHVDGLRDPTKYLKDLQSSVSGDNFYVVVEKITLGDEVLPQDWPVSGTTGYDFLNQLNSIFVNSDGLAALDAGYIDFIESEASFHDVALQSKKQVVRELFPVEVAKLCRELAALALHHRHACDIAPSSLAEALVEITIGLAVYRTYIDGADTSRRDKDCIERAAAQALEQNPGLEMRALDFVRRVLSLEFPMYLQTDQKLEWLDFVMRWQQFTGPVTAKGIEDTTLYRYNRLTSMNDVSGEPDAEDFSLTKFHETNSARQSRWPHTMNATSTHDTKRGEDVRARINILSEISSEWNERVAQWRRWNEASKPEVRGAEIPDANTEMLIYQTMIGAWPLNQGEVTEFRERLKAYLVKASREAKVLTSWLSPNEENEAAMGAFIDSIFEPSPENEFLQDFLSFQKRTSFHGALNSLSQVLLKAVSPGVPDFYQGTELWDFSLVDPDNRRPVDFAKRKGMLDALANQTGDSSNLASSLLETWSDGRIKLYLTWKALNARKEYSDVFMNGDYTPIYASDAIENHVCALAQRYGNVWIVAATPRYTTRLCKSGEFPLGRDAWGDGLLVMPQDAPKNWRSLLTNESLDASTSNGSLKLSELFATLPVALLVSGD